MTRVPGKFRGSPLCDVIGSRGLSHHNILDSRREEWGPETIDSAIRCKHYSCMIFLFEEGCQVDCNNIITFLKLQDSSIDVSYLQYMLDNEFPIRKIMLQKLHSKQSIREDLAGILNEHGYPVVSLN